MLKPSVRSAIRLRGVRHNNLKNFDLDLPLNQLIVVTGLSGSGKSSLAFDTLFAEGQRRYIETFSPYARQFLDRMDKPQVDSIEGIPPAIAIEQRNSVRTTRSTVGTMTEICDYMKLLWPHVSQLFCRQCGRPVRKDSPQQVWVSLSHNEEKNPPTEEFLVTFNVPLSEKLSLADSLALVAKQGYQRVLINGKVVRIEEASAALVQSAPSDLTVIQDRLKLAPNARPRFIEACEQAYHFGKGKLSIYPVISSAGDPGAPVRFSNRLHCARCDLEYREPSSALFSFNNPLGACPSCRGFGRVISIDYNLALPDRSKTLAQGAIKPWQTGQSADCQRDLLKMCRHFGVPMDVPFEKLPKKWQDLVIDGEPDYGKDEEHEWPRAWYGIRGYFRWLESKAYKMHVRVLLSRYRTYSPCSACAGRRFQPDALLYKLHYGSEPDLNLADFYLLPIRRSLEVIEKIARARRGPSNDPLRLALTEVESRLRYLAEVGLGYLTLDRPTRSLSGGETERVSLTTCLGTRLVNTLFVLDEPSVGLHPRDTDRLIRVLQQLRDSGNTVLVVEHEASVMRAADQIVDLGPGHGASGGQVAFQGTYQEILKHPESLTGRYLSGRARIEIPTRRAVQLATGEPVPVSNAPVSSMCLNEAVAWYGKPGDPATDSLRLSGARLHNLRNLSIEIPLNRFVCVTGVSGSGKTTLIREVLLPTLAERLKENLPGSKASDRLDEEQSDTSASDEDAESNSTGCASLEGAEHLDRVVLVDQSILGKTPRSNPAVYTGAFEDIREFYAASDLAKRRGLNSSAFSFNSSQGQCERCRGAGFEKIEMQFLSDVFIRCPDCDGRRYRSHILDVKLSPSGSTARPSDSPALSIADLLDATVDEAILFLEAFPESRYAQRALKNLRLLRETGLGYLKLGQPINTLSGGESQRLKLVKHLADSQAVQPDAAERASKISHNPPAPFKPTLFLFDEPTTGLHFDDVRVLLKVFQRLVNSGHSVVIIEHNLDVIKSADWVIDLGPEAGDLGGQLVAVGTPEQIAQSGGSHTGEALRQVLNDLLPRGTAQNGSSNGRQRSAGLSSAIRLSRKLAGRQKG
jgi:excinuclease ABC subunit A